MIAWLDIETTGLIAREGSILEVAVIVTDDKLEPIGEPFQSLVKPHFGKGFEVMDDFVREMHKKSGLLERLYRVDPAEAIKENTNLSAFLIEGLPRAFEVEARLVEYLTRHAEAVVFAERGDASFSVEEHGKAVRDRLRSTPFGGSSVHFDRAWLDEHMAKVSKLLSHRHVDVSTVNELALRFAPELHAKRPNLGPDGKPLALHQALADIRSSIETLCYYRSAGFIGGVR